MHSWEGERWVCLAQCLLCLEDRTDELLRAPVKCSADNHPIFDILPDW